MAKQKRKWTRRFGIKPVDNNPHPENDAGKLTEHAARQPLVEGIATVQVNYGTINFHIYR